MYIPQHEWRFREHVIMCNTKVDEESVEVEQDEKDQVVWENIQKSKHTEVTLGYGSL